MGKFMVDVSPWWGQYDATNQETHMQRNPKVEAMIDAERNTPPKPGERQMPSQFAIRNLSVLAYANGFTLWHYKAGKTLLAEVAADGFFSDASDMVAAGDFIIASASDGGRVLVVSCSDSDTVTTAGMV